MLKRVNKRIDSYQSILDKWNPEKMDIPRLNHIDLPKLNVDCDKICENDPSAF